MSKHLVLSMKHYDFNNDKNERIFGAKLFYINKKISSRDSEEGHAPLMVSLNNPVLIEKIKNKLPAICEMEFEQVTGKNNKPEIVLIDVEYISAADLSIFF